MADKKLITYDCVLSFSFQTKDDDFMNPDFNFGHMNIVCDVSYGGLIHLFGDSKSKHSIIISGVHDLLFSCVPIQRVKITSADLLKSMLSYQEFDSINDCVFCYQPIKGSRFFLGVKEIKDVQKKNDIKRKPETVSALRGRKKT